MFLPFIYILASLIYKSWPSAAHDLTTTTPRWARHGTEYIPYQLQHMFVEQDKNNDGFMKLNDLVLLLSNEKKLGFCLRFLISVLKNADRNGDNKINFFEFKQYISRTVDESQDVPIPVEHLQPVTDKKN